MVIQIHTFSNFIIVEPFQQGLAHNLMTITLSIVICHFEQNSIIIFEEKNLYLLLKPKICDVQAQRGTQAPPTSYTIIKLN